MFDITDLIIAFIISLVSTIVLVFPVKKLAIKINAMDFPNYRKIHVKSTPRLGGLAIFCGVVLGLLYLQPQHEHFLEISIGALIIIAVGILDDKYQIRPIIKLSGQVIAAVVVISSGLVVDKITIPLFGVVELTNFSIFVTLLWMVGITNAINLIDGLDGLASGVSTIALISIMIMAIMDAQIIVVYFCTVLIASNIGFLFHNFHPASIYMGDSGSMFIGYSISVISMLGLFKNVTLFSFIIPVIVLAVPIFDTLFAILRRWIDGKDIMMPDNKHIHYQLLSVGYSHRASVLIIYGFTAVFGFLAILFSNASLSLSLVISFIILFLIHILAEIVGVVGKGKKPIINLIKQVVKRKNKENTNI